MLKDIERGNFDGIGKPEPLKGELSGFWSRRIDDTNRFEHFEQDCLNIGPFLCGERMILDQLIAEALQKTLFDIRYAHLKQSRVLQIFIVVLGMALEGYRMAVLIKWPIFFARTLARTECTKRLKQD